MPRSPSVLSSWAQLIVDALDAQGHDSDAVLRAAGLSRSTLGTPGTRQPLQSNRALWHAAIDRFADPACGLMVSRYVRLTTFHALGYSVVASGTLREALYRLLRYSRIVSDAHEFRVEATPDRLRLVILPCLEPDEGEVGEVHLRPVGPETVDAVMSLVLRTCRFLAGRDLSPLQIEQRRATPADLVTYDRFFRCPLQFGANEDAITLAACWLDRPLPSGNPILARHNDELLDQHLEKLDEGQLSDKVRRVLDRWAGEVPAADVAHFLGLSERSLQRRLKADGTSYAQLLDESREELARAYLREAHRTIDEVALQLGFHSASTFARAFRRWTQVSPAVFRKRYAAEAGVSARKPNAEAGVSTREQRKAAASDG